MAFFFPSISFPFLSSFIRCLKKARPSSACFDGAGYQAGVITVHFWGAPSCPSACSRLCKLPQRVPEAIRLETTSQHHNVRPVGWMTFASRDISAQVWITPGPRGRGGRLPNALWQGLVCCRLCFHPEETLLPHLQCMRRAKFGGNAKFFLKCK